MPEQESLTIGVIPVIFLSSFFRSLFDFIRAHSAIKLLCPQPSFGRSPIPQIVIQGDTTNEVWETPLSGADIDPLSATETGIDGPGSRPQHGQAEPQSRHEQRGPGITRFE